MPKNNIEQVCSKAQVCRYQATNRPFIIFTISFACTASEAHVLTKLLNSFALNAGLVDVQLMIARSMIGTERIFDISIVGPEDSEAMNPTQCL